MLRARANSEVLHEVVTLGLVFDPCHDMEVKRASVLEFEARSEVIHFSDARCPRGPRSFLSGTAHTPSGS